MNAADPLRGHLVPVAGVSVSVRAFRPERALIRKAHHHVLRFHLVAVVRED
jgi:hypothetical protein